VVHGGIIGAVLDEIVTCAASVAVGTLLATATLDLEFRAPVRPGERYLARAWYVGPEKGLHVAQGALVDEGGTEVARARGRFVVLTPRRAQTFGTPT
jgi:uncharacterized protein (TIGR00369 family)